MLLLLFKEEDKEERSQRTNPRHVTIKEIKRERDRIKKRTDLLMYLKTRTGYGHRARFALLRGECSRNNTNITTRTDGLVSLSLVFSRSSCSSSRGVHRSSSLLSCVEW